MDCHATGHRQSSGWVSISRRALDAPLILVPNPALSIRSFKRLTTLLWMDVESSRCLLLLALCCARCRTPLTNDVRCSSRPVIFIWVPQSNQNGMRSLPGTLNVLEASLSHDFQPRGSSLPCSAFALRRDALAVCPVMMLGLQLFWIVVKPCLRGIVS